MDNKAEKEEKPILSIYPLFNCTQIVNVKNYKRRKE